MTTPTPIRVEIDHSKFWTLAGGQPIHMNISVLQTLKAAGIPVDGGIEFRAVHHGRLTMWNERRNLKRYVIYEWVPGPDSEDEEL